MTTLADLLNATAEIKPKPDAEAIPLLVDWAKRYSGPQPYAPGDLVTYRDCVNLHKHLKGRVAIVLETKDALPRDWSEQNHDVCVGSRRNTRIAIFADQNTLVMYWCDHVELRPWRSQ